MLNYNTATGELVIDDISMHGPAWNILDLRDLWMPASIRGSDTIIPGAIGVLAHRRRVTVTRHTLPMALTGECDKDGIPAPGIGDPVDLLKQLQDNIDYLRENVVDPTNVGNGTRAATLTMPDGSERTADIHVEGLTIVSAVQHVLATTLNISIPAGLFT